MSALPHSPQPSSDAAKEPAFDWPLAYEAEQLLYRLIESFLSRHAFARALSDRMREATGTDFYEWVDYLTLSSEHQVELTAVGLTVAHTPAPAGIIVMHHPKAMMPRVLLSPAGSCAGVPAAVAVKPEVLTDFLSLHAPTANIEADIGARYRRALVAEESGLRLEAVERLGYRDFLMENPPAGFVAALHEAQTLFKQRRREFADDAEGIRHARDILDQVLALVPREVACELFFAEERRYWEQRNLAARVQRKRQDSLGLGWGNHDHHTFRCSRRLFPDVVQFLELLGLQKRERFYAGAEAGWGAQVMESSEVGIVVFADVDLRPDEVNEDYAAKRLPEGDELGTVGLWCALHGDSFLQAGMHHLEARFDFVRLRDQLAQEGVATMKPFSDFPFLKQAFTEGERWTVKPDRVARLVERGAITKAQAEVFLRDGAIGSHLENLQRKGGFKGFNQQAVSAIIAETDPRRSQATT
ncbi:MAG: hypothetical protein K9M98_03895 [Cephaloticoccus sp.]|nr:hypothetical protein [Cephaloticoccus sp.]MCF7759625.1 hypothetical protein [Cephaloticoccus sp.]